MVEDGNWVTSRQPSGLPAFIRGMIARFSRSAAAAHRSELSADRNGRVRRTSIGKH